ncbi:MAG TPA: serine--tRNA ligase [Solirubrobacteraceae bacterium]|nr:serine--tRNA ligase [Solirubrobacteraceae bacterium]
MLDLKLIRDDPDGVRAALARRGGEAASGLDRVIELDRRRRALLPELEGLRAEQNEANTRIRAAADAGEREREIAAMRGVAARAKELERELGEVELELQEALAPLPNLPDPTAAPGPEDELVREVGTIPQLDFQARDHLELAGALIDMDRAAKLSGARFAYLKGDLVMLELALVRWALEKLRAAGFEPVIPPVLVRERALYGTGFLPDTEQQIYSLPADELFLVGTSEVALASLHDGEILDSERLPLRYAGFSPCFRREAGAAGKDTRGIFRVHQFDKVEMFSFVSPEDSAHEHERILAIEEEILGELELPYRVVNIAVGDLGNSAAKKYDCEAWLPSQGRYRELTSCSNTTDYQARRLNIRARGGRQPGAQHTRIVHTLNGTAVAVGRTLVALLENGQRADGSVELPRCLTEFGAPPELAPTPPD